MNTLLCCYDQSVSFSPPRPEDSAPDMQPWDVQVSSWHWQRTSGKVQSTHIFLNTLFFQNRLLCWNHLSFCLFTFSSPSYLSCVVPLLRFDRVHWRLKNKHNCDQESSTERELLSFLLLRSITFRPAAAAGWIAAVCGRHDSKHACSQFIFGGGGLRSNQHTLLVCLSRESSLHTQPPGLPLVPVWRASLPLWQLCVLLFREREIIQLK